MEMMVKMMFTPMWLWFQLEPPRHEEHRVADVIQITERHRARRRQKILRRMKRGY